MDVGGISSDPTTNVNGFFVFRALLSCGFFLPGPKVHRPNFRVTAAL